MGIKSLLVTLKQAITPGSIEDFANKTIAVDISCLLHRSFSGCAKEVARGQKSDFYITFVRRYIDLLLRYNCHVILVFDGKPLPAKKETNASRNLKRTSDREKAEALLLEGNNVEAYKFFQSAASITSVVVEHTIAEFSNIPNVDIVVAPYEADAQLAYLVKHKIADAVVTEDSDLILFGCSTIIYKLSWSTGACDIYDKSKLADCFTGYMRRKFNFDTFRYLCIIMGCDYFPGIPNVGFKKGVDFFDRDRGSNIVKMLKQEFTSRFKAEINNDHVCGFLTAHYTFLYQIVYCPLSKKQVPFHERPTEYPKPYAPYLVRYGTECFTFAGTTVSKEHARRLVIGNRDMDAHPQHDIYKIEHAPTWSIHHPEKLAGRTHVKDSDVAILPTSSLPGTSVTATKRTLPAVSNTASRPTKNLFAPPQPKLPRFSGPRTQQLTAFTTSGSMIQQKTKSQPIPVRSPAVEKTPTTSIWSRLTAQVVKKGSQESPKSQTQAPSTNTPVQQVNSEKLSVSTSKVPAEIVPETQLVSNDTDEHALTESFEAKIASDLQEVTVVDENNADKAPKTTNSPTITPKRSAKQRIPRFHRPFAALEVLHKQMPLISPKRVDIRRSKGNSPQNSPSKPSTSATTSPVVVTSAHNSSTERSPAVSKFFGKSSSSKRKSADGTLITTVTSRRHILGHSPRGFREVFGPGNPPQTVSTPCTPTTSVTT